MPPMMLEFLLSDNEPNISYTKYESNIKEKFHDLLELNKDYEKIVLSEEYFSNVLFLKINLQNSIVLNIELIDTLVKLFFFDLADDEV